MRCLFARSLASASFAIVLTAVVFPVAGQTPSSAPLPAGSQGVTALQAVAPAATAAQNSTLYPSNHGNSTNDPSMPWGGQSPDQVRRIGQPPAAAQAVVPAQAVAPLAAPPQNSNAQLVNYVDNPADRSVRLADLLSGPEHRMAELEQRLCRSRSEDVDSGANQLGTTDRRAARYRAQRRQHCWLRLGYAGQVEFRLRGTIQRQGIPR